MATKTSYVIEGINVRSLEDFWEDLSRVLIPGVTWGRNLDALNDILRGGFGTPDEGFILIWKNSKNSKEHLGYSETIRQLSLRLKTCHTSQYQNVTELLEATKNQRGPTVFDWLTCVISDHGPTGSQSEDNVELRLD